MIKENIVAIVGRPNVGKSSLFNRLVGKRTAIVDNQPGVTRDRHYGQVKWAGKQFTLIDTGGYMPSSQALFDLAIREQVEIAIEQADILLFVVDAHGGISDLDSDIAKILRKFNKPVIVSVNKVDDDRYIADQYAFLNLGLGDVHPVSAMTGRHSGDLLDTIVAQLSDKTYSPNHDLQLAVIGKENVGKSSFVNAICGQNRTIVTEIAGTTRDSIDTEITYFGKKINIIDTAGLKRKTRVKENILFYSQLRTISTIDKCDVAIVMISAEDKMTKEDLRIINDVIEKRKGLVIVVNKWDLVKNKDTKSYKEFIEEMTDRNPDLKHYPISLISVNEKQRVFKVLDAALEVFENRKRRISTSKLNAVFQDIFKKFHAPALQGKEIKINYVTQVEVEPPQIAFFSNYPDLISKNHKKFLENQCREHFNFTGVPILFTFKHKNKDKNEGDGRK